MLAYPIPEAEELLQTKLSTAKKSLENCQEDMDFLREQITVQAVLMSLQKAATNLSQTLEVAFARVYNWDVAQRRKERAEAEESIGGKKNATPNG